MHDARRRMSADRAIADAARESDFRHQLVRGPKKLANVARLRHCDPLVVWVVFECVE
jgi:hypothetical protein